MTRHRCGLWLAVVGAGLWCGTLAVGPALGQAAQTIPADIRTSTNLSTAQNEAINGFINREVANLQNADPVVQQRGRDALIDGIRDQGQVVATATYKSAYSRALNAALTALPAGAPLRTRLNAAIVTARVAEQAKNTGLVPATEKFLADPEYPVALWGMKSARWVLPFAAANALFAANNPLLTAIPAAVQKHPTGAMYEDAYLALALELFNAGIPKPPPASIAIVVPVVQQLIEARTQSAQQQAIDQPLAESRGFSFLAAPEVYRAQTPQLRLRTVQDLLNHLNVIGQKAAAANQGEKVVYVQVINELGGVAFVIGQNENNNPGIQTAATALRQIQVNTPGAQILSDIAAAQTAFGAVAAFNGLKPPPGAPANTGAAPGDTGSVAGTP